MEVGQVPYWGSSSKEKKNLRENRITVTEYGIRNIPLTLVNI
jgi:hypothetical protein